MCVGGGGGGGGVGGWLRKKNMTGISGPNYSYNLT